MFLSSKINDLIFYLSFFSLQPKEFYSYLIYFMPVTSLIFVMLLTGLSVNVQIFMFMVEQQKFCCFRFISLYGRWQKWLEETACCGNPWYNIGKDSEKLLVEVIILWI